MNDPITPDPDDIISSIRPPRATGYVHPGDNRDADHLLTATMSRTPAGTRRWRHRPRTWVAIGIAGTACLGSGAAAVLHSRDVDDHTSRLCLSEPSLTNGEQLEVDPAAPDPVIQCEQAWTDGLIGDGGPPPPMTACVTAGGTLAVVPGDADACTNLGWSPAERPSLETDRSGELLGALSDRFTDLCIHKPEATELVADVLVELELDNWTIEDRTTHDSWCVTPSVDPEQRVVVLSSFDNDR